jgi:hypothetical protein
MFHVLKLGNKFPSTLKRLHNKPSSFSQQKATYYYRSSNSRSNFLRDVDEEFVFKGLILANVMVFVNWKM